MSSLLNAIINGLAVTMIILAIGAIVNFRRIKKRRRRAIELVGISRREYEEYRETPYTRLQRLAEASIRLTPRALQAITSKQLTMAGLYGSPPRLFLFATELVLIIAYLATSFTILATGLPAITLLILGPIFVLSPRAFLIFRSRTRSVQMSHELPSYVDLMLLVVSGGLGLNAAIEKVVNKKSGILAGELIRTLDDLKLGVNRVQAFSALVERTGSSEVRRFADAIMKVDQLGVSLTTVLRAQAAEMRHRNRVQAREQAQRVSVKILFPLILCFLPGLFIVVVGPAVINIISSLGG